MPGLPNAPPSVAVTVTPPALPVPSISVPNLPSLPVPPTCSIVIPIPSIGLVLTAPQLPVVALCGFIPPIPQIFIPQLKLPSFLPPGFPPPIPPIPKLPLPGINCLLNNPLAITCGVSFGGGRKSQTDPDPDLLPS